MNSWDKFNRYLERRFWKYVPILIFHGAIMKCAKCQDEIWPLNEPAGKIPGFIPEVGNKVWKKNIYRPDEYFVCCGECVEAAGGAVGAYDGFDVKFPPPEPQAIRYVKTLPVECFSCDCDLEDLEKPSPQTNSSKGEKGDCVYQPILHVHTMPAECFDDSDDADWEFACKVHGYVYGDEDF